MDSDDVIELGSSEDEAEPVLKKVKQMPNAMVHIPNLHGVTIKPAKPKFSIPKELAGRNVTITKISNKNVSLPHTSHRLNGKPKPIVKTTSSMQISKQNKTTVNTVSLMKKINSQVVINKIPTIPKITKIPIRIQSPRSINNLQSNMPVAKNLKRIAQTHTTMPLQKRQCINPFAKRRLGEVLTVELDDDVVPTSTAGPQWYLRPEDQVSLEEENNKEPEISQMVEITIEDSPVKPLHSKIACKVGDELSITIDDSPVKVLAVQSKNTASGSDVEERPIKNVKTPTSKKKLEYPKEQSSENASIEIEVPPLSVTDNYNSALPIDNSKIENDVDIKISKNIETEKNSEKICEITKSDNVIEIEESPMKIESQCTSTPKKNKQIIPLANVIPSLELGESNDLHEFHPVYRSFISLCFQLENSDDMKKIVEKKIKTYYRQVPKDYTESEDFIDMVSGKIVAMKAAPEKMYLYIKDIVDELNLQRKLAKSELLNNIQNKDTDLEKMSIGDESEYDTKRQRQIRKLEKTLKKLHRAIQKLEEQEVDFDDDEDSVYLLTESDGSSKDGKQLEKDPKTLLQRYKERMVRVHAKFCQLTNTKMPSEPRVQLDARPGHPTGPVKRLEKWVNKKVPIGTPLPFPDFHDVVRCVKEANEEDKLGWNEADIIEEARDLFTRCGKKLQRRRQENEWRLAASRIASGVDPAQENEELKKKLEENSKVASQKETEVFKKYADRQSQLKLEAEEIGDKEAEQSLPESDDEDSQEESSLQNKDKRKERLKRLIEEKSQKNPEEKDFKGDDMKLDQNIENRNDQNKNGNESPVANVVVRHDTENEQKVQNGGDIEDCIGDKSVEKSDDKVVDCSNVKGLEQSGYDQENCSKSNQKTTNDNETIHSLSDDSNRLDSDIDELHLLQKLHSGNEMNTSTLESSDTDAPIAISDSMISSSDSKKKTSDVISIENSSYSESEEIKEVNQQKCLSTIEESVEIGMQMESSTISRKNLVQSNNDEYNESIEDILLASSEDEKEVDEPNALDAEGEFLNLKDDSISIGDTIVGDGKSSWTPEHDLEGNEDLPECMPVVSLQENKLVENDSSISKTDEENVTKDESTNCALSIAKSDGINIESSMIDKVDLMNSSDQNKSNNTNSDESNISRVTLATQDKCDNNTNET